MSKISCIFFGTPHFSVPSLARILESDVFNVRAVVTQEDKPKGRSKLTKAPPVKTWAERAGLRVLQPNRLSRKDFEQDIHQLLPLDSIIVVAYGKIIPHSILTLPRLGAINLHPSLLPLLRGPSPIQSAIMLKEKETGVSIMLIDDELDHGPVLSQRRIPIQERETYTSLHDRLADAGARLLVETIIRYVQGDIKPKTQRENDATFTHLLTKQDGLIDWEKSAEDIDARVRALNPWPSTYTTWKHKRLAILEVEPTYATTDSLPGTVIKLGNDFGIATSDGILKILTLKLESGRALSGEAFLRGHSEIISSRLFS